MRRYIDNYRCTDCQHQKIYCKGYGLIPERELREQPFEEVAVDFIDLWKVQLRGKPYEFNALTCTDTVPNLVELVRVDHKTSQQQHTTRKFA